jgi:phenylacetate-CoA ligase
MAGYAASLEGYLDWLRAKGRRQEGVESAVSAAESAGPRLRQLCQEVLGAPLFETYSAREFFNVASECEAHAGLHVSAENLVVETDEEGELLVTDLRNEGMPLIRYRIGDGGVWAERACGCGRGLPVLARVEGRIYETLQGADGRRVPGEYFGHLFKDCPKVRQYQVAQRGSGMVEVRLVLHEALRDGEREDILRKTRAVFGPGVEVRIEVREELPLLPSGKRQLTVRLRE